MRMMAIIILFTSRAIFAQSNTTGVSGGGAGFYQYAPSQKGQNQWEDPTKRKGGLTDQEKNLSETFIHVRKNNQIIQEGCKDNEKACAGLENSNSKDVLFETVAKAYSLFMGMNGADFKVPKAGAAGDKAATAPKDSPPAEKAGETGSKGAEAGDKAKDETVSDYCKYIPMGTEMLAATNQQIAQQNIDATTKNQNSEQKTQLYKVANTHEARAKTAGIQEMGWGATSACYLATGAMNPSIVTNGASYALKTAASVILFNHFGEKKEKQLAYKNMVKGLADQLKGPGECNPITERDCYCSDETSKNDPQYCLPQIYKAQALKVKSPIGCIDNALQADPSCKCLQANTCYDVKFQELISGTNFGQAFAGTGGAQMLAAISRGNLDQGGLNNSIYGVKARGSSFLKENAGLFGDPVRPLSREEIADSRRIASELGIPLSAAQNIMSQPMDSTATKLANQLKGDYASGAKFAAMAPANKTSGTNVMFSGGHGIAGKKSATGSKFDLSMLNQKKGGPAPANARVLQLAEAAQKNASQINQDSDRPLFQIISRRYQISGWRQFEITK